MVTEDVNPKTAWIVDWSDDEQADFEASWSEANLHPQVFRSAHSGSSVGTRMHRARSYPIYAQLAIKALRSDADVIVAWQALAGVPTALLRRGGRPRVVVLQPTLRRESDSAKQRLVVKGLKAADHVVCYSMADLETCEALGVDRSMLSFVPLGVRAKTTTPMGGGDYLMAGGREHRDWKLLAKAAEGIDLPVKVGAPNMGDDTGCLDVVPPLSREDYREMLMGARALIVPLIDESRPAGTLAVLQALSYGIPVIATRGPATADYVPSGAGIQVTAGDQGELHEAMRRLCDPVTAATMGSAALAAAQGQFALTTFVATVDEIARTAP